MPHLGGCQGLDPRRGLLHPSNSTQSPPPRLQGDGPTDKGPDPLIPWRADSSCLTSSGGVPGQGASGCDASTSGAVQSDPKTPARRIGVTRPRPFVQQRETSGATGLGETPCGCPSVHPSEATRVGLSVSGSAMLACMGLV